MNNYHFIRFTAALHQIVIIFFARCILLTVSLFSVSGTTTTTGECVAALCIFFEAGELKKINVDARRALFKSVITRKNTRFFLRHSQMPTQRIGRRTKISMQMVYIGL